jgi:hypothetical protein
MIVIIHLESCVVQSSITIKSQAISLRVSVSVCFNHCKSSRVEKIGLAAKWVHSVVLSSVCESL